MTKDQLLKEIARGIPHFNDYGAVRDAVDAYTEALIAAKPHVRCQLKGEYTAHFIEWMDRFFDEDMKILEYKSKSNGNRYTVEELEKMYNKAMLQSPFNCT